MTYRKKVTELPCRQYVSEETRWAGNISVNHIPISYE